jgi:hypothetical protein
MAFPQLQVAAGTVVECALHINFFVCLQSNALASNLPASFYLDDGFPFPILVKDH